MSWQAWKLDPITWGWIVWLVWFAALEGYSLRRGDGQELTEHLRPILNQLDLMWFLAVGLWLWIGFHFLVDGVDFAQVFNIGPRVPH